MMLPTEFRAAVEEILEMPRGTLKDSDSRDTVETWTSIADLQILTFISSEFGVEPEPEFMEAKTFGDLLRKLEEKLGRPWSSQI